MSWVRGERMKVIVRSLSFLITLGLFTGVIIRQWVKAQRLES